MGVWIEIIVLTADKIATESLPSWECGLKSQKTRERSDYNVTPFMGVWIEIRIIITYIKC